MGRWQAVSGGECARLMISKLAPAHHARLPRRCAWPFYPGADVVLPAEGAGACEGAQSSCLWYRVVVLLVLITRPCRQLSARGKVFQRSGGGAR
jgi:hypothetical protein